MIATASGHSAIQIDFASRDEWLAARSGDPWAIGASDAVKIACGRDCSVWVEKKLKHRETGGSWFELGHVLEPAIGDACRRIHGWTVEAFPQTSTLRHSRIDWIRCTPDFVRLDDGWEPINVKNISVNNPRFDDFRKGLVAKDHFIGAQWELLCTGAKRGWIVALVGGAEVVPFPIDEDRAVQRALFKECAEFRLRYLLGDEEPAPDAESSTARALRDRAAYEPGAKVYFADVSPETDAAACRLDDLEPTLKSLTEERDRLRNAVRAAMKNAQVGVSSSGRSFRWSKSGSLL